MKVWILSKGVVGVTPQIQISILVVLKTFWVQSRAIGIYFRIQTLEGWGQQNETKSILSFFS